MRILVPLILLGFPALDIYLLFPLGKRLGWWLAVWLVMSAITGVTLIREARFSMLKQLAAALQDGGAGLRALIDSGRILVAGLLFIFPGVLSDLAALLLLLTLPQDTSPPARCGPRIIDGDFRRAGKR
jgi:UPF0716 protein FxsA